ncbi:MAG TPA: polysaccharide deacetylase family protein [Bacillota bacterium]|nr:polysaccharide deacetylase family protein [Bacillota bacterium]
MKKPSRIVSVILIILVVIAAGGYGLFQISKSRSFQFFGGIVQRVNNETKVVALTFDDGPTKSNTEPILTALRDLKVKATFFVIGAELRQNMNEGREIAAAGHELGNHSYSHKRMVLKSLSFIRREIEDTDQLIRGVGYKGPIQFRPPFGKKLVLLPYYLDQQRRKTILWDVEPDSYPEIATKPERIVKYTVERARPGSIILLHVMYKDPKDAVTEIQGIVTSLKKKGYQFKTVSELLEEQNLLNTKSTK